MLPVSNKTRCNVRPRSILVANMKRQEGDAMVMAVDHRGRIIYVNTQLAVMLGYGSFRWAPALELGYSSSFGHLPSSIHVCTRRGGALTTLCASRLWRSAWCVVRARVGNVPYHVPKLFTQDQ